MFRPRTRLSKLIILIAVLVLIVLVLYKVGIDDKIIVLVTIAVGLLTQAFAIILSFLALIPLIGPILVSFLSLPIVWIIKALTSFVMTVSVSKGEGKQIMGTRVLGWVLFVGMIMGYILAYFIPMK